MIPEGWQRRTIGALCQQVTSGGTPNRSRPEYYSPGTIPWIKTGDLADCVIDHASEFISELGLAESSAKLLPKGTVLMAMYGATAGRLGILSRSAACNQASCALVAGDDADYRWIFYSLWNARERIVSSANGAAQQNLSGASIRALEFMAPNVMEQRAIGEVLGALDDKIAANRKLASTADRLAREIYRSIVRDAGVAPLSSTARFVNGRAFTKGATGAGRVVVRIAELNSGISGSTVYNDIAVASENVARPGDLLFAWSGSLTLHRWYRDEAIVNQHIFKVIPNIEYPMWLVNQLVLEKLDEFKSIAADKATTMGHIQRRHLDEPVRVPSRDLIAANDVHMDALWNRALVAERENLTLAATRDTLLPKLMSGKLRVKEAERIVSEVA